MTHIYFFLVGAIFASFMGLVIDRFPEQSIIKRRSRCNCCGTRLAKRDLIPILSAFLNHFRCRFCGRNFPTWYSFFELIFGLLFFLTSLGVISIPQLILLLMGLTLSIYDLKHLSYPFSVWLSFELTLLLIAGSNFLVLLFLILAVLAYFFDIKIGAGDFLFLASCAAAFSLTEVLIIIQIACLTGLLLFAFTQKKGKIAFVPCLFLAVCLLVGLGILL